MAVIEDLNLQKLVISLDSDEEPLKNDRSCTINNMRERIEEDEEENEGKINKGDGSGGGGGGGDNKYVYRTKAEEYKMLADLSKYPQLLAMFAFEARMNKKSRKRNEKKRRKKNHKIESQPPNSSVDEAGKRTGVLNAKTSENGMPQKLDKQEKMAVSDDPKLVVSLDNDDKPVKNDRSCEIDKSTTQASESKKREHNEEENEGKNNNGVRPGGDKYVYMTKAEEYRMLADLSKFPQLAAMFSIEARMKRQSRKRNKRRKKQQQRESEANIFKAVETTENVNAGDYAMSAIVIDLCSSSSEHEETADLRSSTGLAAIVLTEETAHATEENKQANTCKAVETTEEVNAGNDVRSVTAIDLCSPSLGNGEIADMGSSRGLVAIVPTKAIADATKEGKQPDTAKALGSTKEMGTESVPRTEIILAEKLFKPEKMAVNDGPRYEKLVISVDIDGKPVKNDRRREINQSSTQLSKLKKREHCKEKEENEGEKNNGVRPGGDKHVYRTKAEEYTMLADLSEFPQLAAMFAFEARMRKKSRKRNKNELREKKQKIESEAPNAIVDEAGESAEVLRAKPVITYENGKPQKLLVNAMEVDKHAVSTQNAETMMSLDLESVERKDNFVLQKLLRGPRYFDSPEGSWQICYKCGTGNHSAVDCSTIKRKKPCFICGDFEHYAKHCKQGNRCFNWNRRGHLAKDFVEKDPVNNENSKICLRCGDPGHDMFSCSNAYPSDDLKEIQCCVCKEFGHLCCVDFIDEGPREVSCFKCGKSGHLGSGCTKLQRVRGYRAASLCYNCGDKGHFARECINYAKAGQCVDELTPLERFPKQKEDSSELK